MGSSTDPQARPLLGCLPLQLRKVTGPPWPHVLSSSGRLEAPTVATTQGQGAGLPGGEGFSASDKSLACQQRPSPSPWTGSLGGCFGSMMPSSPREELHTGTPLLGARVAGNGAHGGPPLSWTPSSRAGLAAPLRDVPAVLLGGPVRHPGGDPGVRDDSPALRGQTQDSGSGPGLAGGPAGLWGSRGRSVLWEDPPAHCLAL